jgi:single-strand DNA-binding protein
MSRTVNEVHLLGHAGRDAEVRYTPTDKLVVKFSLATGGGKKQDGGQYPTEWHNVIAWEQLGKHCECIRKGAEVEVWGRIQTRSWDDAKTGTKKYMTEIVAQKMQLDPADESQERPPVSERPRQQSLSSELESARPAPVRQAAYCVQTTQITDDDIPF